MPTLGGAEHSEIVVPLPLAADAATVRNREDYNIVGKLKPGLTLQAAQAELDAITARLRRDHPAFYPPNGGLTFSAVPLQEQVVGNVRHALIVLTGAVALVLLIAGLNVANLLLARAAARRRETAVRAALGAGRAQLLREPLAHSLLLALLGGALGVLLCVGFVRALVPLGSASVSPFPCCRAFCSASCRPGSRAAPSCRPSSPRAPVARPPAGGCSRGATG
jgi:hypothetical protein